MQYALVNGLRSRANPGLAGVCQSCNSPVLAKCGDLRAWHWAHRGDRRCDPWWEETEWHVNWKSRFPTDWQEVLQRAESGERHIADIRTPDGCVLEFQHSRLAVEERNAREAFYKKMVWIVDGLARKRDLPSFQKCVRRTINPLVYSAHADDCALLRDWVGRPVDVFLDFGGEALWLLHPTATRGALLTPVSVSAFITMTHRGELPFEPIRTQQTPEPVQQLYPQSRFPRGLGQHWRYRKRPFPRL